MSMSAPDSNELNASYLVGHDRRLHPFHFSVVVVFDHKPAGLQVQLHKRSPGFQLFHEERVQCLWGQQGYPLERAVQGGVWARIGVRTCVFITSRGGEVILERAGG